jgi:preprotein translocase subunit YajC
MRTKFVLLSALGLAVAAPLAPAAAQAPASISVGMQVVDASGGPVGTVKSVQGDNILVKTDRHEALLPKNSFTPAEGKLLFGMTQAQLNAEIEKGLAAADASIAAGATVKGAGGSTVGTIDSVTADAITITLASGTKVQLARTAVRGNADGTVTIGLSAEQLEAQVQAAGANASSGN